MTPDPLAPTPGRVPARTRILKLPRRRALALSGALAVLGLVAAACGGGGGDGGGTTVQAGTGGSEAEVARSRPRQRIHEHQARRGHRGRRGGNLQAVQGDNPCDQPGGSEPILISYVGANLAELDDYGLEAIVVEEPALIIDAYTNEVNFNGGINGHCVEFVPHIWSLGDPQGDIARLCTELPQQRPVFFFSLRVSEPALQCATLGAQIPMVGLYAFAPASTIRSDRRPALPRRRHRGAPADGQPRRGAVVGRDQRRRAPGTAARHLRHGRGRHDSSNASGSTTPRPRRCPPSSPSPSCCSRRSRWACLEGDLTDEEQMEAQRNLAALPAELAGLFGQMEQQFFLDTANRFKEAGVTAVVATAEWSDVRRLIRAAELV